MAELNERHGIQGELEHLLAFNNRERRKGHFDPTFELHQTHTFLDGDAGIDPSTVFGDRLSPITIEMEVVRTGGDSNGILFEFGDATRGMAAYMTATGVGFAAGGPGFTNTGADTAATSVILGTNQRYRLVFSAFPGRGAVNMWVNGELVGAAVSVDGDFDGAFCADSDGAISDVDVAVTDRVPSAARVALANTSIVAPVKVYKGQRPRHFELPPITIGDDHGSGSSGDGDPPSPFACDGEFGQHFDGTNDLTRLLANHTGLSDSKVGTINFWVRFTGDDGANQHVIMGATNLSQIRFRVLRLSTGAWRLDGWNSDDSIVLTLTTTSTNNTVSKGWIHFIASWDLANSKGHLYIDDVVDEATVTTVDKTIMLAGYTIPGSVDGWAYGGDSVNGSLPANAKVTGSLSHFWFDTSYLDLDVTANRRKFITAGLAPAEVGTNGSTPTGSAPKWYFPDGDSSSNAADPGNNEFTITGALTQVSGPGTCAVAAGEDSSGFDGTNDFASLLSFTGEADSKLGICSFWAKMSGGDSTSQFLISGYVGSGQRMRVERTSGNIWLIQLWNAAGDTAVLSGQTATADINVAKGWHHVVLSWKLSATQDTDFFVDGADDEEGGTGASDTNADFTYASTGWRIGNRGSDDGAKLNAEISEFYLNIVDYLDMHVAENLGRFISGGLPVDLGEDGSVPTGNQPLIYLPNGDPTNNKGSGGNMTLTGALVSGSGPGA